ncbi:MAG: TatD family deoxyribonuclease [Deltaproteobacteria bacterium]|nr:MAG: TatD family deoxyribonuclease [Deltaproteobacteria bacterium]
MGRSLDSPKWFDSHCHLGADEFSADRAEVAARAFAGGVEGLLAIGSGYGVANNARAIALAESDPRVWASVGVHPHEAVELDDAGRADLARWLGHPRVVAVGEAGLDYHYMNSPREVQRAVFAEQVGWARERGLPVSIHVRGDAPDAYDELLDIWTAERGPEVGGVLHCYTGSLDFARRALDAALDVSFSGILTFRRDRGLREVAAALPLARILVETDAPLLAPEGHRGRRNEPLRVVDVGRVLAQIHQKSEDEVAHATTRNARARFRLPT